MSSTLSRPNLVAAMQDAGLGEVDRLLMHSSLHSLGRVDGGAETLIDALLEVLGEEGTLMVPTFNYNLELEVFDPATVRSQTGLITETLRKRPEAIRSLHPNYSVAAIGRDSEELTREHWKAESTGVGSPIDRIARSGGFILLLGVKQDARRHQGQDQLALTRGPRGQQLGEAESAHGREHGLDVSLLEGGDGLEGVLRGQQGFPLKAAAQQGDRFGGQLGEIGKGAGLNLTALAVALAQQDGGGRAAVGDGGDVHDYHYTLYNPLKSSTLLKYKPQLHAYTIQSKNPFISCRVSQLSAKVSGNFGLESVHSGRHRVCFSAV